MSIFSEIQLKKPGSSTFDLSHQKKLSGNMGRLIPIFLGDTVPGDKFNISTAQLLRMAPMVAPIMHQVTVYTHFFFVPNRILWPNWEDFITGGDDGLNVSVPPTITIPTASLFTGTVGDYMGLPTNALAPMTVDALPFSAYLKIYDDYYRDQNLQPELWIPLVDGDQTIASNVYKQAVKSPLQRAWQHDYFTSALPWTQKGPQATIPLGTSANVLLNPNIDANNAGAQFGRTATGGPISTTASAARWVNTILTNQANGQVTLLDPGTVANHPGETTLIADLSTATAATINDLRSAIRLQEWLEKNARGGSRYIESILSHFGVRSSDARLQRPEFLGGGQVPINVSEVLQTSASKLVTSTGISTPQGTMAGHGISVGQNNRVSYKCEEHGYIVGIMSVMPKTAYQQGIPKKFLRKDKFDYYWPEFAHLGEQAIQNQELFIDSDPAELEKTFGYIPRYAEYKYENDTVHGEMRDTLKFWHLGRIFANQPQLNAQFIACDPSDRIFAVLDQEHFYAIINHSVRAKRLMPYFGTPTL